MTKANELALSISEHIGLFALDEVRSLDDARHIVKDHMKDESATVIDNTAEALLGLARRIAA